METTVSHALGSPGDEASERDHPKNRPGGEGQQIGDGRRRGGQGQRRENPEEMGTPSEAMKGSDPEGRMRMASTTGRMVPMGMGLGVGVDMEMGVCRPIMRMLMGVDLQPRSLPETPDPYTDQHRTHQTLTPPRDRLDRQRLPKTESRQPHKRNPGGMPKTPAEPDPPRPTMGTCHQRRHRRQMIRSRPDVEESSAQTKDRNQHHARMDLAVTRGNRRLRHGAFWRGSVAPSTRSLAAAPWGQGFPADRSLSIGSRRSRKSRVTRNGSDSSYRT